MHRDAITRRLLHRFGLTALALGLGLGLGPRTAAPALAQAPTVTAPALRVAVDRLDYSFAETLDFRLEATAPGPVEQVLLRYTIGEDSPRNRRVPEFEPGGTAVRAQHEEELVRGSIPPASVIRWWWSVILADGRVLETAARQERYMDERFEWQSLESEHLRVWWYDAPRSFAEDIQDQSNAALDRLEPLIGSRPDRRIEIVAYRSQLDLRDAMFDRGAGYEERLSTLGARVAPDILILDAGTGGSQLEEVIAHELSHIVLNLHFEEPYMDAPLWLDEGLAMYVEGPLDAGEQRNLDRAIADDRVMSVLSLTSFPGNPDQVELAYAQSRDFVSFLIQSGGEDRFRRLLDTVGQAEQDMDEALTGIYGYDQLGLYQAWRAGRRMAPAVTPAPGDTPRPRPTPLPSGGGLPCGAVLWLPVGLLLWVRNETGRRGAGRNETGRRASRPASGRPASGRPESGGAPQP